MHKACIWQHGLWHSFKDWSNQLKPEKNWCISAETVYITYTTFILLQKQLSDQWVGFLGYNIRASCMVLAKRGAGSYIRNQISFCHFPQWFARSVRACKVGIFWSSKAWKLMIDLSSSACSILVALRYKSYNVTCTSWSDNVLSKRRRRKSRRSCLSDLTRKINLFLFSG